MTTPTIELKPSSTPLSDAEREAILANPGFGRYFTDHMVIIKWTEGRGWHDGQLVPYGPLSIDPATNVLHYAQEIFEGLKAYRQPDGSVATFRPEANAERFQRSAHRLAMPELPVETFIEACDVLVQQDKAWVPAHGGEESLYLRPFMIASEVGLGVKPANEYLFIVIASPAGAYFPGGVKPVSIWLSENRVRAVPGGMGDAKTGGNYAASLLAQAEAAEKGCEQVAYLDAVEHKWVEELGGMNLYFVYGDKIVTPALTGSLLAGVTRDSLLRVARDLGYESEEGRVSIDQWRADTENGTLTEVFACGTAAVITPVGIVKSAGGEWTQSDGKPGEVTMKLRDRLLDVQRGIAEDTHGWMHPLG
ncbi:MULTISPECIES: branched-chain amino acid aminotransferase [unclassified Streptomyces]|uniref:branched-chain amino acid aminotransferase n=1 Tax=unclassified Streptomyces TaxID=2593676 RepID=UPI002DD7D9FA|nr:MULTISPECIES: branched-chain amino acid aminotransferase [unclassified Streptomyces]WSF84293.1 branched-chain amino acid aminotransferase [Streptomyces sp. NBC_01744]WSC47559.1 branched-chain amino acid aminotransferase [Streptomyces sp. NBC_01762]WSC53450.1 branched-chain amino acid aminotransferase [Streptomyces sp. NBC_01761]WSD27212.1 branched-chain amino acid aminotransferase [Streptomyces sp. NBC_01751]WSJ50861.1 branched-chain amino acid aminotransferase [Streptomyces sp. NBC_01318]